MFRFLLFLNKISFVLLFVVIQVLALRYYSDNSGYNRAKLLNVSNRLAGDIYVVIADVEQYFGLAAENRRLMAEAAALRESLSRYEERDTVSTANPAANYPLTYQYTTARVVNNSIARKENFITLDKGLRDGITKDMAIISNGAIAGYVLDCSDKFSVAMSVLNTGFRASGRILGSDYFGPIHWDGNSYEEVTLSDIPKYATISVGDTIVTTEFSSIFPPGILIGTVKSFRMVNGVNYEAVVKLSADMGALNNVIVVRYKDLEEKRQLEESAEKSKNK